MIPVKHIDPDDLALYAMQLLPAEEMEEMSMHLQHSAEARRMLSEIYGDLSILAHSAEMQAPPALARQRLMKHVAREKKVVPINVAQVGASAEPAEFHPEPVKKNAAAKVLPWVGWALAAGLALPLVNLYRQREQMKQTLTANDAQLQQANEQLQQTNEKLQKTRVSAELANSVLETVKDPKAVHVTLTASDQKPPPQGRASYVAARGSLVFLASNLDPLKANKTYELWLIPANGQAPIPAGTFKPDARGNASVVMPRLPKGVIAKAFGVTIEDAEGSTTPTAPILLKGAAS